MPPIWSGPYSLSWDGSGCWDEGGHSAWSQASGLSLCLGVALQSSDSSTWQLNCTHCWVTGHDQQALLQCMQYSILSVTWPAVCVRQSQPCLPVCLPFRLWAQVVLRCAPHDGLLAH